MENSQLPQRIYSALAFLAKGDFRTLTTKFYKGYYGVLFFLYKKRKSQPDFGIKVMTQFPVAVDSPDHLFPAGTKNDNSTNRSFILLMNRQLTEKFPHEQLKFLDLGCAGGQLVRDFRDLGYVSVGLEGSDYSLKHKRANWPFLVGKNLFTCDITKPFEIKTTGEKVTKFNLITAWEVLEHIPSGGLEGVFNNIVSHLKKGGYFIASTSSSSAEEGPQYHQTIMTNLRWREYIEGKFKELEPVDLGFKYYQYVRYVIRGERSFLTYKKIA